MCPLCMTTVVLIAGSVAATGGLAAVAVKKFGVKKSPELAREPPGSGDITG